MKHFCSLWTMSVLQKSMYIEFFDSFVFTHDIIVSTVN